MKRMYTKMVSLAVGRSGLAFLWCLVAAVVLTGEPRAGQTQTSDQSTASDLTTATEQLFDAVHANDFPAVQASVAAGADVEASDRWGMNPMELAIDKGYFEIGHYLVAVRNFSRSSIEKRPPVPVAAGSPFGSTRFGQRASGNPARSSPLGPLSRPAANGGAEAAASANVDIETSAGPPAHPAGSMIEDNPFDPNTPAHGSGAFTVGEVGGGASEVLSTLDTRTAPLDAENVR